MYCEEPRNAFDGSSKGPTLCSVILLMSFEDLPIHLHYM